MDTLSHNWHQNGFNEVVDVNAVFFTDSLELAVNGRVNLEANVLPIEHGLGVLGGQPHRIYFDVAVSLLKEHCPRFWNTAKPPITDRVLHDPELQGQRVDATFGFYGFVENVHALSVSRS